MAEVKSWADDPPVVQAEPPARQYGYALLYIHSIHMPGPGLVEVEYAVVAKRLFEKPLPPHIEQQMFNRWMMQYRAPFTVHMDDGWTINFF